jgi:plasmid maintenance system antidote protein VapI
MMSGPSLAESKILYLKEVMKKEGMDVKDLSIKLDVTEAWIKMLLKGDQNISRFILQKLHKLSGLSFDLYRLSL